MDGFAERYVILDDGTEIIERIPVGVIHVDRPIEAEDD